jgi:Pentapeptide repeats (8 copies)
LASDSHHIDVLRRGPRVWNAWRAEHPDSVPNLTGITLSAAERQMGPINGGPINLAGARLRHASLRFATLSGADLSGADLSDTDLSEARLNGANLSGADLTEALLDQADFTGARLAGADLSGTTLLEVRNITQAQLDEAIGDPSTVLPPHLSRPQSWTGTVSNVVGATQSTPTHEEMPKRGPEPDEMPVRGRALRDPAPQVRGERVSWLVGGPRAGDTRRSTTPLRGPER